MRSKASTKAQKYREKGFQAVDCAYGSVDNIYVHVKLSNLACTYLHFLFLFEMDQGCIIFGYLQIGDKCRTKTT